MTRKRGSRAVGYTRVSTSLQAERGAGLEAQRRKVREHAARRNLDLLEVVREAASGAVQEGSVLSHEHRPALTDLLSRAAAGEFEVLIVASFDRLSRDYASLIALRRLFRRYGVEVVSATEEGNGNGDPFGDLIEAVMAAVAEFERARILERVRSGKAVRKAEGRFVHGAVPYGYRLEDGELRVDQERADVVRRIFLDASEGATPGRIATMLSAEGIPGPRRGPWNRITVGTMLRNRTYLGELHGVKKAHEPIVSARRFNVVQRKLDERARKA